jgi:hypothetical protein
MKGLFILHLFSALCCKCISQNSTIPGFPFYPKKLTYDDTTKVRLRSIADSLQEKFKQCAPSYDYYSIPQCVGYYISMESGRVEEALSDIRDDITWKDFCRKFKKAKIERNVLITMTRENHWEWDEQVRFEIQPSELSFLRAFSGSDFHIVLWENSPENYNDDCREVKGHCGNWVFEYFKPESGESHGALYALYLPKPCTASRIPPAWSNMIFYSDFITDTSVSLYLKGAHRDNLSQVRWRWLRPTGEAMIRFCDYINRETQPFAISSYPLDHPYLDIYYDSLRDRYISQTLSFTLEFRQRLGKAAAEAIQERYLTSDIFEAYTARYYSPNAALALKRNREVWSPCGNDPYPVTYVMGMASLAASTANWPIFLKSHLFVLFQQFSRLGSAGIPGATKGARIKDLEDLGIDVPDLFLGMSFNLSNPAANHYVMGYFCGPWPIGLTLADLQDRQSFEKKIQAIIIDPRMDDYNRLIMHELYENYIYFLPLKKDRFSALKKLSLAHRTLPNYLSSRLRINRKDLIRGWTYYVNHSR